MNVSANQTLSEAPAVRQPEGLPPSRWSDAELIEQARAILDQHGLGAWQVSLDHARRRAGCCYHQRRTISLSKVLLADYPQAAVREVVLHEAAHAIAGPQHRHDRVWKETARRLGATPRATLSRSLPQPEAPWVGTCPRCGAARNLYRSPRRVTSCGACSRVFSLDLVLEWSHEGRPALPAGAYRTELARLKRQAG